LNPASRSFFEKRFQQEFGGVRVYVDDRAVAAARTLEAEAFTVGSNIVFGAGRYRPVSSAGRCLLAHELSHVVAQRASGQARIERQPRQTTGEEVVSFGEGRQLELHQWAANGRAPWSIAVGRG
jgi:hypothetical protein